MEYNWVFKPKPALEKVKKLQAELNISEIPAELLVQRGISSYENAKTFFRPSVGDLHNPFLMKDMQKAVDRVLNAIASNEKILIFGDYDVDGTTAVSQMFLYLRQFTPYLDCYIPDRYSEGYGVSFQGVDYAYDNGFTLIIALDCGIKSVDKVAYARQKNIDFIICDHHLPSDELPQAEAILNPKQADCQYPYNELCGCGVGFKLIQALQMAQGMDFEEILPLVDFSAVAIAADIVPITGENRTLMHLGLAKINKNPSVGILALLGENQKNVQVRDIVFGVAPRINAAGRIRHGIFAVELLTETSYETAFEKAKQISFLNDDRKEIDEEITQHALHLIQQEGEENNHTTVVFNELWHKGVIGIVASRLIETYYRPTLVFTQSGDKLAASARSVQGFDIYQALEQCSEYIEQFGGHKYAAGLTILPENYTLFKQKFEEVVKNTLPPELKTPTIEIDLELPLENINTKMFGILKQFEPFGPANISPIFYAKNVVDTGLAKVIGKDEKHLKLTLKQVSGTQYFSAVGFNLKEKMPIVRSGKPFRIVYSIEENHWQGQVSLQLKVRDIRL